MNHQPVEHQLILENLNLPSKIYSQMSFRSSVRRLGKDECIGIGNLALARAATKFVEQSLDKQGRDFESYAAISIRRLISWYARSAQGVHVPKKQDMYSLSCCSVDWQKSEEVGDRVCLAKTDEFQLQIEDRESLSRAWEIIKEFPPRQRKWFRLVFRDGLTYREAGNQTGYSHETVRLSIKEGIEVLKSRLL